MVSRIPDKRPVKFYPDTSFLCALYRSQDNQWVAQATIREFGYPLPFTDLLEFEFQQATRLQVFLFRSDRSRGFSVGDAE